MPPRTRELDQNSRVQTKRVLPRLNEVIGVSVFDQADQIIGTCFTEDVFAVCFYCSFRDKQLLSNLFVGEFFTDQLENFAFSVGEQFLFSFTIKTFDQNAIDI